jgi:hypothetical protein
MDTPYTMGSDHEVYQDSSFKIPAIYLNDWPDRYIHTNFDTAANIDPTKLKRAAFIGAASGYFLAKMTANDTSDIALNSELRGARLSIAMASRVRNIELNEHSLLNQAFTDYVEQADDSIREFLNGPSQHPSPQKPTVSGKAASDVRFVRRPSPRGPVTVFGYDFVNDHTGSQISRPKLFDYQGLWGGGEEYAYETLNFTDGKRNAQQIRDAVSAEFGPVPLDLVLEYLRTLEKIGIVEQVK